MFKRIQIAVDRHLGNGKPIRQIVQVNSLIFDQKVYDRLSSVVALHALSDLLAEYLSHEDRSQNHKIIHEKNVILLFSIRLRDKGPGCTLIGDEAVKPPAFQHGTNGVSLGNSASQPDDTAHIGVLHRGGYGAGGE